MEKKDKLYISLYNDYYGVLLTDHQRELVSDYYDKDLSLAEIGLARGISPQGVRDALKRSERQLEEYESKLGLVRKTDELSKLLDQALQAEGDEVKALIRRASDMLNN